LLSYVTIANFRHKHKGKALAGSLPLAERCSLVLAGYAPRHSPPQVDHGTRKSATTIAFCDVPRLIDRRREAAP